MHVLHILAADYANVTKDGKINVMGIFNRIFAHEFPTRQPEMHLIVKLDASPAEYDTVRKLTIKLLDETGKQEIVNWSRDIHIPIGSGAERAEISQILRLRDLVFPTPGTYQFSVIVDKDEEETLPITVALMGN